MLCRPNSVSLPFTPEERFDRNKLTNQESNTHRAVGQSENGNQFDIRSLMIDIARNFHSVETIKVEKFNNPPKKNLNLFFYRK